MIKFILKALLPIIFFIVGIIGITAKVVAAVPIQYIHCALTLRCPKSNPGYCRGMTRGLEIITSYMVPFVTGTYKLTNVYDVGDQCYYKNIYKGIGYLTTSSDGRYKAAPSYPLSKWDKITNVNWSCNATGSEAAQYCAFFIT